MRKRASATFERAGKQISGAAVNSRHEGRAITSGVDRTAVLLAQDARASALEEFDSTVQRRGRTARPTASTGALAGR